MQKLRELRLAGGLTMKSLGDKFGLSESSISLYENDKREADYATLKKFSSFFGVTVDYLLENEQMKTANVNDAHLNNTPTAQLPNDVLEVAAKYAVAPEGIQISIRKLLDIAENNLGISRNLDVR